MHAWATSWGTTESAEWALTLAADGQGTLTPPVDAVGVYRLSLTTDVLAPGASEDDSAVAVETTLEIRPAVVEAAWLWPLASRSVYAAGEAIPFRLQSTSATAVPGAQVDLVGASGVLASWRGATPSGGPYEIPPEITHALDSGLYRLRVSPPPGFSTTDALLRIGARLGSSPYPFVEHGDMIRVTMPADIAPYGRAPQIDPLRAAAIAAGRAQRAARRGTGMIIERIGAADTTTPVPLLSPPGLTSNVVTAPALTLQAYLAEVVGWLGAVGLQHMAILVANDAAVGTAPDGTLILMSLDNFANDALPATLDSLRVTTPALQDKAGFRGWCWAANWWTIPAQELGNLAESQGYTPRLQQEFADVLGQVAARSLVTATSGPVANPCAWPPVTFANVDEVDLHRQSEQIAWPFHAPFAADFYARPGKRALAHPQLFNDRGTGEQLLPVLLNTLGRGAATAGNLQGTPPWGAGDDEARLAYRGSGSTSRALARLLAFYGNWWTSLASDDRIAILARRSTFQADSTWSGDLPAHLAAVYFAHTCCLYAQRTARIVFDDDLLDGTTMLDQFDLLVLVDEQQPLESPLTAVLAAASTRTSPRGPLRIVCDASCSDAISSNYQLLLAPAQGAVSFAGFNVVASSDYSHWVSRDAVATCLDTLTPALDALLGPADRTTVTGSTAPGTVVHARSALKARYLLIVDDTPLPLEPPQLWRATLRCASRLPSVAQLPLQLNGTQTVYDVFAGTAAVFGPSGSVSLDLRALPGRLLAVLPAPVSSVRVSGPSRLQAGQTFHVQVEAVDANDQPLAASLPVQLTLSDDNGTVIEAQVIACAGVAAQASFTTPARPLPATLHLQAIELLSGCEASLDLAVDALPTPVDLAAAAPLPPDATDLSLAANTPTGAPRWTTTAPAATHFGPHAREIALTDSGGLAVIATADYGENVYALDTATGAQQWTACAGQFTAFSVSGLAHGVAAGGFTFTTSDQLGDLFDAEGYGLYFFDDTGAFLNRIAGVGRPRRMSHRFRPDYCMDPQTRFAISQDGTLVISTGNLGLAAWQRDGDLWRQLWTHDTRDRSVQPIALAHATITIWPFVVPRDALFIADEKQVTLLDAITGLAVGSKSLPDASGRGRITELIVGDDQRSGAIVTDINGGCVYLVYLESNYAITTAKIPGGVRHCTLSHDSQFVAISDGTELRIHDAAGALCWSLPADDVLDEAQFSPDDSSIAVLSHLGTLYVLAASDGNLIYREELESVAALAWLPEGDLTVADWSGTVSRRDSSNGLAALWTTKLQPGHDQQPLLDRLARGDPGPTYRAAPPAAATMPDPGSTPLLQPHNVAITLAGGASGELGWLHNDNSTPPQNPLFDVPTVEFFAERPDSTTLIELDFWRQLATVDSLTLDHGSAPPETWLRDVEVYYWDRTQDTWPHHATLVFDAAAQTRGMPPTPATRKLRLALPWGLVTNLTLTKIQTGGTFTGYSHPDVVAAGSNAPGLVRLFDSRLHDMPGNANAILDYTRIDSDPTRTLPIPGCNYYLVCETTSPYAGPHRAAPQVDPQMNTLPDWEFEISDSIQGSGPPQFAYLQFAWQALDPAVTGLGLRLGSNPAATRNAWNIMIGTPTFDANDFGTDVTLIPPPPGQWQQWHYVRVNLSQNLLIGSTFPATIRSMFLAALGGEVAFDQIVLARTLTDLPDPPAGIVPMTA